MRRERERGGGAVLARHRRAAALGAAGALLAGLAVLSVFVGVSDLTPEALLRGEGEAWTVLWVSRVPRTLAVLLAGSALAVAGTIMQLIARNRFVEPSTVGTVESAMLGALTATVLIPGAGPLAKMAVASLFALAGTALFLALVRRIPPSATLLVPLVGIMLGGVVSAVTAFAAYEHNLLQVLNAWMFGDFSRVLAGRYELLWIVAAAAFAGWFAADRFTVAAMGAELTTGLGLDYRGVLRLGLAVVAVISAVTVTSVGALPFLGLVVPNAVSALLGDNLRAAVPWTALGGAALVLVCDLLARTVRFPFEVPVGLVMGVVGSAVFLTLLLRDRRSAWS